MANLYPAIMLGDRVETWDYVSHGRADGPSTFGVVLSIDPMMLETHDGTIVGTGDVVRVVESVPRPRFTIDDRIPAFREAVATFRAADEERKKAQDAFDRAYETVRKMRQDVEANGDGGCPHPTDLTFNHTCQVCGLSFDDGYW